MSKITIELYDPPQGPQWLAYPDVPWKGGRVFTAAEKIAHQLEPSSLSIQTRHRS